MGWNIEDPHDLEVLPLGEPGRFSIFRSGADGTEGTTQVLTRVLGSITLAGAHQVTSGERLAERHGIAVEPQFGCAQEAPVPSEEQAGPIDAHPVADGQADEVGLVVNVNVVEGRTTTGLAANRDA